MSETTFSFLIAISAAGLIVWLLSILRIAFDPSIAFKERIIYLGTGFMLVITGLSIVHITKNEIGLPAFSVITFAYFFFVLTYVKIREEKSK